ncbi:hypothetical protein SCLCIDRAFT_11184 [Scleroderma citrinum Foug A]|uniref:Uncharacterized protein n=1 Tax=Scleroderma citrinum Foug A TaxID=1036808 RepID=A0A0C3DEP2_9AGAM|nr:hypothetical protein SCLCIDRAFT_11184 [Scleroderma citrinum Foug A]
MYFPTIGECPSAGQRSLKGENRSQAGGRFGIADMILVAYERGNVLQGESPNNWREIRCRPETSLSQGSKQMKGETQSQERGRFGIADMILVAYGRGNVLQGESPNNWREIRCRPETSLSQGSKQMKGETQSQERGRFGIADMILVAYGRGNVLQGESPNNWREIRCRPEMSLKSRNWRDEGRESEPSRGKVWELERQRVAIFPMDILMIDH